MRKFFLIFSVLYALPVFAVEPPGQEPIVLDAIHNMRMRQESEENVFRVIQTPMPMSQGPTCTPVDRVRDRIKDLPGNTNQFSGTVNVQAGHENVTVESNEGSINNSVNVQIVNPDDTNCL
ncbi:MAG: hypothetical protein Q7S98_05965 [Deltaproteobacteria bacterium]|nr:hypothetical protein [Deltaproteobacteria bacterium]